MKGKLLIKRVYLPASDDDGERCLVDRLWPRGLKKENAAIDGWLKDIAPSNEIRKYFNHEPEKFPMFRAAYKKELSKNEDAEHNNAVVLRDWILQKIT